ncbi:MAG: carbohydrate kinase [Spirochaetaceae bacterium 4572_59]|nr:MAG: carbohydrate kinase [Spirochaetaceae bacterium 4572_59]
MNKYFMGIDNGGTMCKAVIFDNKGKEIASASKKLDMITPSAGFTERNMEELWNINTEVISKSIANAEIGSDQIKGIACTGHGKGLYLVGKDDNALYNGIVSTDSRAWEYPLQCEKDGTAEKVFKKTYQKILACQPVSLLRWLKDNEPQIIEQIKWIFEVKDYIRFKLTGEAFAEITDYSGSNLLNLETKDYDKELLSLYGLEEIYNALPPLKNSTDLCGRITEKTAELTGLLAGTPVSGGMFDIDACAIAMDICNEENICVIAGTWGINEYISKKPVLDKSIMMNSVYCMEDYYLIEESSPTSAGNLEWYISMFLEEEKKQATAKGVSVYDYCDKLAASVEPEEQSIIFLPYIFGSNYNSRAKACFIGLDSHHTRAHMVRAVFEGIVFCHMVHLEKLLANRHETRAIRLAGGAAKSQLWAQMFSDITALPVETIDTEELGALGCAMAAAVTAGEYSDLQNAATFMVAINNRFEPDREKTESYRKKYEHYKKVSSSLNGLWNEEI